MKTKLIVPVIASALMLATACSHRPKDDKKKDMETASAYSMPVTEENLTKMTEGWPLPSKTAITALHTKYGLPSAVTEDMVIWKNSSPFKRSIVYKEEIEHRFPIEHKDILVQTVDYRVPRDKVAELAKFDGSILIDRTKGELSARNEKEEMNILSLNLADRIVRGELSAEKARREYGSNAEAFATGTTSNLISDLGFRAEGNTQDPDATMQSQVEGQPIIRDQKETKKVQEIIEN